MRIGNKKFTPFYRPGYGKLERSTVFAREKLKKQNTVLSTGTNNSVHLQNHHPLQLARTSSPIRYSVSHGPYRPLSKFPSSEAYRSIASSLVLACFIHYLSFTFHSLSLAITLLHLRCPATFIFLFVQAPPLLSSTFFFSRSRLYSCTFATTL
ncbi:hypothetical protein L873DRAFT_658384 [Choiromyces venosus 120613-1]|uniref:Uncharacterized protein n=1 Tax=Choiromyces venosus 120613-1 TaxID=1336337 RepID=A0A3N4JWQ7_9PEZI|nr:hypothetical protein L873DRAFT_658384 [Choiromyces venosus 120613-1]